MSFLNKKSEEERGQEKKETLQEESGLNTTTIEAHLKTIEKQNWIIIGLLEEIKYDIYITKR